MDKFIPLAERKRLRDKRIVVMHKKGHTVREIAEELHVSNSTVFFALNKSHRTGKSAKGVTNG